MTNNNMIINFDLQRFGDYFATCGISNLPIKGGDRAVCVILRQRITDLTTNYIDSAQDLFELVCIPIRGTADNYSDLKIIDDNPAVEKWLQVILKRNESLEDNYRYLVECRVQGYALEYFHEFIYDALADYYGSLPVYGNSSINYHTSISARVNGLSSKYGSYSQLASFRNKLLNKYPYIQEELIKLVLMDLALTTSRRYWSPQIGAQRESPQLDKFINKLISSHISNISNNTQPSSRSVSYKGVVYSSCRELYDHYNIPRGTFYKYFKKNNHDIDITMQELLEVPFRYSCFYKGIYYKSLSSLLNAVDIQRTTFDNYRKYYPKLSIDELIKVIKNSKGYSKGFNIRHRSIVVAGKTYGSYRQLATQLGINPYNLTSYIRRRPDLSLEDIVAKLLKKSIDSKLKFMSTINIDSVLSQYNITDTSFVDEIKSLSKDQVSTRIAEYVLSNSSIM